MSSNDLISSVAKKLQHYVEVGRREDGFDLSPMVVDVSKVHPLPSPGKLHDQREKHYISEMDIGGVLRLEGLKVTTVRWGHSEPSPERQRTIRYSIRRQMSHSTLGNHNIAGASNVNYCNHRAAGYLPEPLALYRRAPPPYISKGELVRLVSSASRLIEAAEVVSMAGEVADTSKTKSGQTSIFTGKDIFLPAIQTGGETKRKTQSKRHLKGRGSDMRMGWRTILRPGSPDPRSGRVGTRCRTAVSMTKKSPLCEGTAGAKGGSEMETEAVGTEGSPGTGGTQAHTESFRKPENSKERDTENRELPLNVDRTDTGSGKASDYILEEEKSALFKTKDQIAYTIPLSLEDQNVEADRPSLLRSCLALSGGTGSSSDQSESEDEREGEESFSTGNAENKTVQLMPPTVDSVGDQPLRE